MKKLRSILAIAILACFGLLLLIPSNTSAASAQPAASHPLTTPISGTLSNGDTFAGTFNITKFVSRSNHLFAVGTASGAVKNASGATVANVASTPAALPVTNAVASCSILALTLGPLDLNLLGLYVHLNQVVLNITAIPGAGSLLGNLLCAITNLLNGGTPLAGLVGILNQILAAL